MENKNTIELNVVRLGGNNNGKVPSKLSELENDMNFATKDQVGGGWRFVKTLVDLDSMDVTEYSNWDDFGYYLDENGNEYPRTLVYWNRNNPAFTGNNPVFYDADTMNPMCVDGWEKEAYPPFCNNRGAVSIGGRTNLVDVDGNPLTIETGGKINTSLSPILWVKSANGKKLTGRIDLYVKN